MKIEDLIKEVEEKELSKYELILITRRYVENNDAAITKEFFIAIENEIFNLIFDFKNSLVNELTNDPQIMKFFNNSDFEICELIDEYIENDQTLKESSENLINSITRIVEINTPPIFENGKLFLEYLYIYEKIKNLQIKQQNKILNLQKIIELQKEIYQPAPVVSEEPQPQNIKPLQWKGEAIELTELVQALIESKLLNPELTQKEIYSRFKAFFEIDFDHEDKKKKIKKRTNTLTPFLEKLMISIENFIDGKD